MNVEARPAAAATPPIAGPAIAPASLTPNANPSISPRRSAGAVSSSHSIAAVQHAAPASPCAKRVASSAS